MEGEMASIAYFLWHPPRMHRPLPVSLKITHPRPSSGSHPPLVASSFTIQVYKRKKQNLGIIIVYEDQKHPDTPHPLSQSAQYHRRVNTSTLRRAREQRNWRSWPWWSTANSKWSLKYFPAIAHCTCLYIQHLLVQNHLRNKRNFFCNININCFSLLIILTSNDDRLCN
jgi:hypothetical protein